MVIREDYLAHYGIKGQQWGERRYQNEDGSLTEEGKRRYGIKYGDMSNEQLQQRVNVLRNRSKFVEYETKDVRNKAAKISNVVKLGGSAYGTTTKALNAVTPGDKFKEASSTGEKVSKAAQVYGDPTGKVLTSREMKEKTAEANEKINELTDEQLAKIVQRLDLEQQLEQYEHPPKKSWMDTAAKICQGIITVGGAIVVTKNVIDALHGAKNKVDNEKKNKSKKDDDSATHSAVLMHYGVKGMSKGNRRYQNPDGSLTPEGYRHYGINPNGRGAAQEAKATIQNEYDRQREHHEFREEQRLQRAQLKEQYKTQRVMTRHDNKLRRQEFNEARAEREIERADTRRNVFKYAIGAAALAGVTYLGFSKIKNMNLKVKTAQEIKKIAAEGKVELDKAMIEAQKDVDLAKEKTKQERVHWRSQYAKDIAEGKVKTETNKRDMRDRDFKFQGEWDERENKAVSEVHGLDRQVENLDTTIKETEKKIKSEETAVKTAEKQNEKLDKEIHKDTKEVEKLEKRFLDYGIRNVGNTNTEEYEANKREFEKEIARLNEEIARKNEQKAHNDSNIVSLQKNLAADIEQNRQNTSSRNKLFDSSKLRKDRLSGRRIFRDRARIVRGG